MRVSIYRDYEMKYSTISLVLVAGLIVYFLPTLLSLHFKKGQFKKILVINFLSGFTWIGWFVLLSYVVMSDPKKQLGNLMDKYKK